MAFGVDPAKFKISETLCAWITQGSDMVCGVIGQGTSMSLTAKWDAPLENSNAGNAPGKEKLSAVLQASTGQTSITTFSSTQIWGGNSPTKFNLVLDFFAWDDADKQVMKPLQYLMMFASSNLKGTVPFLPSSGDASKEGRIPDRVTINVGRKLIIPECVIESVSFPIDKERTSKGQLIRASATLDIQTLTMLNRDHFEKEIFK